MFALLPDVGSMTADGNQNVNMATAVNKVVTKRAFNLPKRSAAHPITILEAKFAALLNVMKFAAVFSLYPRERAKAAR